MHIHLNKDRVSNRLLFISFLCLITFLGFSYILVGLDIPPEQEIIDLYSKIKLLSLLVGIPSFLIGFTLFIKKDRENKKTNDKKTFRHFFRRISLFLFITIFSYTFLFGIRGDNRIMWLTWVSIPGIIIGPAGLLLSIKDLIGWKMTK